MSKEAVEMEREEQPSCLIPELLSEYMKVPATRTDITLMAKVRALAPVNEERRAPVSICAAIDRSGSMKEHLPLLKETLKFMVQQLKSDDKLCLVTFDHEVNTELPLLAMTQTGKMEAEKAIDCVKERGHTNLSGGLLAALEVLYRVPKNSASLVESVLLFTDGKANVGIQAQDPLVKATKSLVGQIDRQVCVFTFGYGGEHDADLLRAVGEAGNGLFYYIDNADSIPESFCDCLGGLLSVVAQNVKLTITAADRIKLHKPLTTYKVSEKEEYTKFEVTIPDIYSEEEKCILVNVTSPGVFPRPTESENLPLASCTIEYFDVRYVHMVRHAVECVIVLNPSVSSPVTSDASDEIQLHKLRCEVADTLGEANRMADRGNFAGAQNLLNRAVVHVQGSRVNRQRLAVHLTQTIQESLEGVQSKETYRCHGKAVMQNYAGSHWQQRSSSTPTYAKAQKGSLQQLPPRPVAAEAKPQGVGGPVPQVSAPDPYPYRKPAKSKLLTAYNAYSQTRQILSNNNN